MLAEKTGWTMDYILWEMPLAILNQGIHSILSESGCKLKRTTRTSVKELDEIAQRLNI